MQNKSRANFRYKIDQMVILIWDQNLGNLSVTNDIENVVGDIARREGIEPTRYLIVYKDSEGRWDGWDASRGDFFVIADHLKESLGTLLNLNLNG
jgi:hypothetical protein